jgi:short-subunit dehydrogenase
MKTLPWKTAYVTGGSSGIGYEVAKRLVESGVDVVLIARRSEKLQSAISSIRCETAEDGGGENGASDSGREHGDMTPLPLDVSNRGEVEKLMREAMEGREGPALLVNSAGIAYPDHFTRIPYEKFRAMMEINVEGTWNCTQVALPHLAPGSHIVNVSSVAGFVGTFGYTAYSASKFAVVGFSEALRNELSQQRIGVSVLCPPDTNTPQLEEEKRTKPEETRAISGNAGALEPERVAEILLRGALKGKFFIIPGLQGKLIYYVQRAVPWLIHKIADGEVKKVAKRKRK